MRTMRTIRSALLAALVLGGLLLVAPEAQATGNPSVCTVDGEVSLNPAVTATPGPGGTFTFNSVTITCAAGSHAGAYTVNASGTRDAGESCASATGSGSFTAGSSGPNGAVSGAFNFTRVGPHVVVNGTATDSSGSHPFQAHLEFIPHTPQTCASGVTSADLIGAATIR